MVWAALVPGAQAGGLGGRDVARGLVLVGEDHEVGRDGAGVGLFQTREGEGARDELARGRVGAGWGLVRVERAAVVARWAVLVAGASGVSVGEG